MCLHTCIGWYLARRLIVHFLSSFPSSCSEVLFPNVWPFTFHVKVGYHAFPTQQDLLSTCMGALIAFFRLIYFFLRFSFYCFSFAFSCFFRLGGRCPSYFFNLTRNGIPFGWGTSFASCKNSGKLQSGNSILFSHPVFSALPRKWLCLTRHNKFFIVTNFLWQFLVSHIISQILPLASLGKHGFVLMDEKNKRQNPRHRVMPEKAAF